MLGIFLRILSVFGWILLAVLLFLLLALLLILFYPVSYRLWGYRGLEEGEDNPKDQDTLKVRIKVGWLAGLARFLYVYPQPGTAVVKLFGFKLYDSGRAEKKEKNKSEEKKKAEKKEPKDEKKQKEEAPAEPLSKAGEAEEKEDASSESETKARAERSVFAKLQDLSGVIQDKKKQLQHYLSILREEDTKQLFANGFFRIGRIVKAIRPRKIRGNICFGTGSPDTTGYCMALYGMLSPCLGNHINITPDFEKAVLTGEILIQGRIMAIVPLFHVIRVALDRRLHSTIKKLKLEDK